MGDMYREAWEEEKRALGIEEYDRDASWQLEKEASRSYSQYYNRGEAWLKTCPVQNGEELSNQRVANQSAWLLGQTIFGLHRQAEYPYLLYGYLDVKATATQERRWVLVCCEPAERPESANRWWIVDDGESEAWCREQIRQEMLARDEKADFEAALSPYTSLLFLQGSARKVYGKLLEQRRWHEKEEIAWLAFSALLPKEVEPSRYGLILHFLEHVPLSWLQRVEKEQQQLLVEMAPLLQLEMKMNCSRSASARQFALRGALIL